jgi:hypothetical protein
MKLYKLLLIVLAAVLIAPASSLAQNACSRDGLRRMTDLYITAQTKGDPSVLPLVDRGMEYLENMAPADISKGIINKPMTIDFHRSIFDPDSCQTFTEVIVTNKAEPYVMGTRLRVLSGKVVELEILWTTTGYWLFNADNYLKYSSAENWSPIPADKRDTRGTLVSAAAAYLDAFLDANLDIVPWGFPCSRMEGGMTTVPNGETPDSTCSVGVPSGVNITNRRFVVDEVLGSVVVFCTFGASSPGGGSGAPDTHLFRVENGKLRYVHTLTHMLQSSFSGNMPADADYAKPKGGGAKAKAKP